MHLPKETFLNTLILLPLLSLLFTAVTASASLTITVPASNFLPNVHLLPAGTHATLTTLPSTTDAPRQSHVLTAPFTHSSSFVFHDLQPESYLLDIRSKEYIFAPYRVDVSSDGAILGVWETFRGNPWENRGAEKFIGSAAASSGLKSSDVTVEAKVLAKRALYEERPKFSPLTLLKNPMILLGVTALGVMVGMPKLLENMDPETRAEFEKQSRSSPLSGVGRNAAAANGAGRPANFDLAGWMAGTSPGPMAGADTARLSTGRESGTSARRRG